MFMEEKLQSARWLIFKIAAAVAVGVAIRRLAVR